jgi:peptidoglycan/xylan/chitin deacetylase (PgdA/CDA1 family)
MKKNIKRYYNRYKLQIFYVYIIFSLIVLAFGIYAHQKETRVTITTVAPTPSVIPLVTPTPTLPPQVESYEVPILMYHYIRPAPADIAGQRLSVSPEIFENQVRWLKENSYISIKMSDLADPNKKEISEIYAEHDKPIALTFDDGYDDAYSTVFPILEKYQFYGTFYIIRNFVGENRYVTQNQIDQMAAAGMEIGSHTLNHQDLTKVNLIEARHQIFNSKENAQTFCYPSGKFNLAVENIVKEAGYVDATTTQFGIANEKSNLFELPRLRMSNMGLDQFKEEVEGRGIKTNDPKTL